MQHTERTIFYGLWKEYSAIRMDAVIPHVPLGGTPGSAQPGTNKSIRYIDALIWFRRNDRRWAIEIKVTKQDLAQELRRPEKTELWRSHTHAFYYAVPPELREYAEENIPKGTGILIVDKNVHNLRRAKLNHEPLDLPLDTYRRMLGRMGKWRAHEILHEHEELKLPE